jgi:hypothetical protein
MREIWTFLERQNSTQRQERNRTQRLLRTMTPRLRHGVAAWYSLAARAKNAGLC